MASEEEIRQNAEELLAINDNLKVSERTLKTYINRVGEAKKMAKLAAYDFDVVTGKVTHTEHLNLILGLDEKLEITDKVIGEYMHHEDKKMVFDKRQEAIATRKDTFYRFRLKSEKFEDWHWFQGATHVVLDENNKLDYVVNVLQDVTDTVKKEIEIQKLLQDTQEKQQELLASEEELRQNSEELQAINDNLFVAQRESEEKQQLLNRAEEIAQMGSFNLDLETNAYSYSENLITIFGLEDSKMTSPKRHLKYIHEDQKSKIEQLFIELSQGKRDNLSETIRFKGDKHENWKFLKLDLYLLRDISKNPFRILGVVQDVTETEINKQLVEKSQKQLQSLSDNLQGIMFRTQINSDWTMDFISNGVEKMTGYAAKEFVVGGSRSFADSIHQEDNFVDDAIDKAIKNKESYQIEYRLVHKDTIIIWVEETGTPVFDIDGKAIYIDGVIMDISARKEVEKLLKAQKQSLDEAQNLAKIVSYDMDIYSKEIKWSESFATVFDTVPQAIPITTDDFQVWIEEQDLDKANEGWARAINDRTSFNEVYRINTPQGKTFYIRERGYPVFDKNGSLISMRGTLQDVTKTELAKQEIERKSQVIEKQNHKFVASVNYAQRIQSATLGGTQEIKSIFKDAFIFFEPKDVVSGDFYWYTKLDEHRKIAIVGDCTGHGVPGAFMSLLGTTILNEIILQRQISTPSKILDELQKQIKHILNQENTGNKDGMDIAVVLVDESVGMLEFAGAKNPLVYIHKKRKRGGADTNLTIIKGDNLSIGGRNAKIKENEYTNHIINLEDIDAFYLYSDGYQDQFGGENGGKFMSTKFRQLLYDTHSTSMRHQRVSLRRTLMNWMGTENDQIDDICIMGITI